MAGKNPAPPVVDDDTKVTEEDLRKDKYGDGEVEAPKEADETPDPETSEDKSEETSEDGGKTDDQTEDEEAEETDTTESADDSSEFVKEFPNIKGDNLEDYARELERTLQLSNVEGKRLSDALKTKESSSESDTTETVDISDPLQLWAKQNLDKQIQEAYSDFSKSYPQVTDQAQYDQFTLIVSELTNTIRQSQNRLAEPAELYSKAAVILGWKPEGGVDSKDKLNMAIKGNASISKTISATKSTPRSKVTDQMVAANKLMYPKKSEAEIRAELEPYVK